MSLIATAFDGWEILRGKMLGAIWSQRFWAFALLILWTIGFASGSIHGLGFIAGLLSLVSFTLFASVLGVTISLFSKTAKSAGTATGGILFLLNATGFVVYAYLPETARSVLWLTACAPLQQSLAIISHYDYYLLVHPPADRSISQLSSSGDSYVTAAIGCVSAVFVYALLAAILWIVAVKAFNRAVGRPRRRLQRASERPAELVEKLEMEVTPGRV